MPGTKRGVKKHEKSAKKQIISVIGVVVPPVGTIYAIWLLWQRLVDWNDIAILAGMYFSPRSASRAEQPQQVGKQADCCDRQSLGRATPCPIPAALWSSTATPQLSNCWSSF
jgi:hypothetical protein